MKCPKHPEIEMREICGDPVCSECYMEEPRRRKDSDGFSVSIRSAMSPESHHIEHVVVMVPRAEAIRDLRERLMRPR